MNFFQVIIQHNSERPEEHWTLKSTDALRELQQLHFKGELPTQDDINRLDILLYADYPLADVLTHGNFYNCFWASERLKNIFSTLNLPTAQAFFFEKKVKWRGKEYPYSWMHNLVSNDPDAMFDFDKSQFAQGYSDELYKVARFAEAFQRTNGSLNWTKGEIWLSANAAAWDWFVWPGGAVGNNIICSEKAKNVFENAQIKGLSFAPLHNFKVSTVAKPSQPAPQPKHFSLQFAPRPRFATPVEINPIIKERLLGFFKAQKPKNDANSWITRLFDAANTPKSERNILLPFLQKLTRTTLPLNTGKTVSLSAEDIQHAPNQSRFFGRPSLPRGFVWPRSDNGRALIFIAQINLSELPLNDDLPAKGLLAFFLDIYGSTEGWPIEKDRNKVCYFEDTDILDLSAFPDDSPINADFDAFSISFSEAFDLPDDRFLELFDEEEMPEREAYDALLNEVYFDSGLFPNTPKLLGWPSSVQEYAANVIVNQVEFKGDWTNYEKNYPIIQKKAREWRLLFQFNANEVGLDDQLTDPAMYFMIREADLKEKNFEATRINAQHT